MQTTLSKRFVGMSVALVLVLSMIPALTLSAPAKAEAATVTAGTIAQTSATSLSKKNATSLNSLMLKGNLKIIKNTVKWAKNKYKNKRWSDFYQPGYTYDEEEDLYIDERNYLGKNLCSYTGKNVRPRVELYVKDSRSTKVYTDKTLDPNFNTTRTFTGYAKLKGTIITGKESKKALKKKIKGKDFTVQYKSNVELGTAQLIIRGVNNYKGTVYSTFSIKLKDITKVKARGAKKSLKVSWSKIKGATGYLVSASPIQVNEYTNDWDTAGPYKITIVNGCKKAAVIKGLMKDTCYQVEICAFGYTAQKSYKFSSVLYGGEEYDPEKVVVNRVDAPSELTRTEFISVIEPVWTD